MAGADTGGMGHNRPPVDEGLLSAAEALSRADDLVKNANRWRAERPKITDQEMAAAAARYITQLRSAKELLTKTRDVECAPFAAQIAALQSKYKDPLALLDIALGGMVALNTEWLNTEQDRLDKERRRLVDDAAAAEEAARRAEDDASQPGATVESVLAAERAREHADRLAKLAGKPRVKAQIRDNIGGAKTMFAPNRWRAEITDLRAALKAYMTVKKVREEVAAVIQKHANGDARFLKDQALAKPGVRFFQVTGNAQ